MAAGHSPGLPPAVAAAEGKREKTKLERGAIEFTVLTAAPAHHYRLIFLCRKSERAWGQGVVWSGHDKASAHSRAVA